MPTPTRTVTILIAFLAVGFYWLIFLAQPLTEVSPGLNRALFVMSAIVYPEGYFLGPWTDEGRLPLKLLDRLPLLSATALWLGLATLIGQPLSNGLARAEEQANAIPARLIRLSLACLAGLALLSTLTLVVGLAGGLRHPWALMAAILLQLVISGGLSTYGFQDPVRITPPQPPSTAVDPRQSIFQRVMTNFVIGATIWLGAVILLGGCLPPTEFDVVEYHLQAPKEFYQAGRIAFVPHNVYINMPLGAEMHSLAAMTLLHPSDPWLGGLIGKTITAAISLVGAVLLGSWAAQRIGSLAGWTAAGIWLGTPGITQVASLGLIDGVLATYVLATTLMIANLIARRARSIEVSAGQVGLACWLGGAAAALKYPGLIYATIPCLLWLGFEIVRLCRQQQTRLASRLAMVAMIALSVTCVPWYAKNWWLTGNPVYPLAANYFGGQTLTAEKIAQWQAAHRVPAAAPADADLAQQVVGQARRLAQDILRIGLTSPYVQPAMIFGVACAIAWLVRSRRSRKSVAVGGPLVELYVAAAWSLWILLVWWSATHRIDRFWLPVTGLWSAMAAWGLWQVRQRAFALAQTMLVSGLLYAVLICSSSVVADNRFFVSLAALRDDLGADPETPLLPPVQVWINRHLNAAETRLLMIGEARAFPYQVDVIYSTCFDTNPGEVWLAGKDPQQQRAALGAAGITHVLINWSEINRYRSPGNYGFSDWPQASHIEQLLRDRVLEPVQWDEGTSGTQLFKVVQAPT